MKSKTRTLSSLRISETTYNNLKLAVGKYNSKNLFQVSEMEFRRMSLVLLSQLVLTDQPLPLVIKENYPK